MPLAWSFSQDCSTRAACISRLNWGWILFQAHSLAVGKSQVLTGCWSETSLGSRHVGVSIGQLMTWQLAFPRVRESEGLQEGTGILHQFQKCHPITFVVFYLLETSHEAHCTLEGADYKRHECWEVEGHWEPFPTRPSHHDSAYSCAEFLRAGELHPA